ncbi:MAG: DUF3037 domain-containing protein [Chloroflexota bacterium]
MADPAPYAYAVLRLVPHVERGECVNAGIVLHSRPRRYLGIRTGLDEARALALDPALDLEAVRRCLRALELIAAGDPAGGRIAALPAQERFGWLTAPASTIIQPGPIHGGRGDDPAVALDALFARLVLPPR